MDSNEALAVQVDQLEQRIGRGEQVNSKEHEDMNKRLDKVLEEALKRWPRDVSILLSLLSALCSGLAVWTFTHAGK